MRFYHEFNGTAPDELSTAGILGSDGDGHAIFTVALCYCGDMSEGARVLQPLLSFGPPTEVAVAPMDYCAFQSGGDAGFPEGRHHYWKASFLRELSDGAIEVLLHHAANMPSPFSMVGLQQMSGVASRVDPRATAFAHRARQYDCNILAQWDDPANTTANVAWARRFFAEMEPFMERSVYANNLGEEGEERVRAAYGANYDRLAALKATYDPTNLFRLNQNILPKA